MTGSIERVQKLLSGQLPDRPPIHDLILNDQILEHFGGRKITRENAEEVVFKALPQILDSTRTYNFLPAEKGLETLDDGRMVTKERWTAWTEPKIFQSVEQLVREKREIIKKSSDWSEEDTANLNKYVDEHRGNQAKLGDVFFWGAFGGTGLMEFYTEIGLEQFCYLLTDCPEIISEFLEFRTGKTIQFIKRLPKNMVSGIFVGEDIAFKTNVIFPVSFLRKEFFPRLAGIIEIMHQNKIKVMFHSDGNLMSIMGDLVDCGTDLLNPFEVIAGMDIKKIHKSYPHLIVAGGIDVSKLLPYGSPPEIRETVRRTIDLAEGKIMVGSSTEIHQDVPLKNFLALYETVINYRF